MKRSFGITLAAVACGLGALLGLLFVVLGVGGVLLNPRPQPPGSPGLVPMVMVGAMALGFCGWAVATMIGLWMLRNWARWSVLLYSGFLVFVAVSSAAVMGFIPLPPVPDAPEGMVDGLRFAMVGFYGVLAVLAGVSIYYFNRSSVKAQFAGANPLGEVSRRPLSISVIAVLLLVSAISGLWSVFMPLPAMLLGSTFTGLPARAIYVAWCACYAWAGFGLLRLRPVSRIGTMALFGFAIVNSIVYYFAPDFSEQIAILMRDMPGATPASADMVAMFTSGTFFRISLLAGCVFWAIPIWFLVKHRRAFEPIA